MLHFPLSRAVWLIFSIFASRLRHSVTVSTHAALSRDNENNLDVSFSLISCETNKRKKTTMKQKLWLIYHFRPCCDLTGKRKYHKTRRDNHISAGIISLMPANRCFLIARNKLRSAVLILQCPATVPRSLLGITMHRKLKLPYVLHLLKQFLWDSSTRCYPEITFPWLTFYLFSFVVSAALGLIFVVIPLFHPALHEKRFSNHAWADWHCWERSKADLISK